jgi:hypothetical protein
MTRTRLVMLGSILAPAVIVIAYGCSDDEEEERARSAAGVDAARPRSAGRHAADAAEPEPPPPPPAIGPQIDRSGRPLIATALVGAFASQNGPGRDAYDTDDQPSGWVEKYGKEIASSLAIYDAIDGVCGNQLAVNAGAGPYVRLASTLADDRLWLDTAAVTCTSYLAVELAAMTGITNGDCGGRRFMYDVIDTTLSVMAADKVTGVDDGVGPMPAKTVGTTFPYLQGAQ